VNRRLAQLLTRLYPRVWRERYGAEFTEFLQDCESGLRPWANIVGAALREHAFQRLGAACSTNFVHFKGAFARLGQFSFSHQLSFCRWPTSPPVHICDLVGRYFCPEPTLLSAKRVPQYMVYRISTFKLGDSSISAPQYWLAGQL
jgi:hypothetical protein